MWKMFLKDVKLMLENFNIFCSFGVIKESPEMQGRFHPPTIDKVSYDKCRSVRKK